MIIYYIKEEEYTCDFVKRCIIKIKKVFNIIKVQENNKKNICVLPILKTNKISELRTKLFAKKLNKIFYKNEIQNIVLSDKLMSNTLLKNIIYSKNINILCGKNLFNYLAYDAIQYILGKQNSEIQNSEIFILVNDNNPINIKNINLIAKSAKRINIVTNNLSKFKELEKTLLENFGIMIRISNNTKKSLAKASLILNMDFPEENINKYNINQKAIIINLNNNVNIKYKKFNGINVNSLKCYIPEKYKLDDFKDEIMYESFLISLGGFENIRNFIKKDKIRIESLIGNNGKIEDKEFKEIYLTKTK